MLNELVEGAKRNPIWFGSIGAISVVQGWLGWEFWGALTDAPAEQLGLRAVGMAFVGGEVVALDMASRAAMNGEQTRANTLRAIWMSLAVLNLSADVNALSRVLQANDGARMAAAAVEASLESKRATLRGQIDRADDPYDNELLPVTAYDAALISKDREIALAGRAAAWRQRQLERERGDLEARRATATQIAAWQAQLDELSSPSPQAAAVEPEAAEFAPLAGALTEGMHAFQGLVGQPTTGEVAARDVRAGVAIGASLAMKIMLTFGIWAGLDRRRRPDAKPDEPIALNATEPLALPSPPEVLPPVRPAGRRRAQQSTHFGRSGQRRF